MAAETGSSEGRWVLKLGSSTLLAGGSQIDVPRLLDYARCIAALRARGVELVLVSSGAVAAGRALLPQALAQPRSVPVKQMLAAIGQPRLMALYAELFGHYGITVAQVLLSRSDFSSRPRFLNARNTLHALLEQGVLPVINENDTVATTEIRVGDNDQLAALVANMVEARKLLLMTDVDGIYTANPRNDPSATRLAEISADPLPASLWQAAGGAGSSAGTGGMLTKLKAAEIARRGGADTHVADGARPQALAGLVEGQPLGTCIRATCRPKEARKRFLLGDLAPAAVVQVDRGAAAALARGSSLLAVGVQGARGEFRRGDLIEVQDSAGRALARGLTRYAHGELERIRGQRSDRFEALLGYTWGDELIHRNDLVLLGTPVREEAGP